MRAFYSTVIAAATIVVASPAFAQTPAAGAAPTCDIEQGKPQAIARATLSLTRANALSKGGDPMKDLRDIVGTLNAPSFKNENPVGRAYMLANAYMLLLEQPSLQAGIVPRSAIGLTTDPNATIDLYAAVDSAITVVEQSSPGCAASMTGFRQQKPWLNVTNAAINALNANKLDSAEIYAKRSLVLDKKSPYAYSILASVAKSKKNQAAVVEYSKQVVATAGTDTAFADVKERAQFELATAATERARTATGAQKQALAREAIAAWGDLAQSKDNIQGTIAVRSLEDMYRAAGDSAGMRKIYEPILANPSKYSEGALLQAGVVAAHVNRSDDAARLFDAVLTQNPYSRDALNNAAASYLQVGENDKAIPLIDRLVALDPSNPDNYMLYAFTYVGKLKKKTDAKTTKAWNDSLVAWNSKSEKMPVKVTFSEFSRGVDGTTLVGTVENRGTVAKTYTMSVELLGPKGEVIATDSQTIGPVAPKASKEFRIHTDKTGVSGYRYKPLT